MKVQALVNKLEWIATIKREMLLLIENKTWKLFELPKDQSFIDSKWVFKPKDYPTRDDSKISKASLMAKDVTQENDVEYNKVFLQVARLL